MLRILNTNGKLAISDFIVNLDYPLISATIKIIKNSGFILE